MSKSRPFIGGVIALYFIIALEVLVMISPFAAFFYREHHAHAHEGAVTEPHAHVHRHAPLFHDHPHLPDVHHRHGH